MKDLETRMKKYEFVTRHYLTTRTPVIIRLDGKAFHSLTKKCSKPFDQFFMDCMSLAAQQLCKQVQGFKLSFIQSDEVNILVTDYDDLNTQGWFDYSISKIISISAGMMSAYFSQEFGRVGIFDSRVFNIPEDDVSNYFVWRAKDWRRNSLNMYARSFFSHRELLNESSAIIHEMLHSIGKNWATDLTDQQRNGTWFLEEDVILYNIEPKYEQIQSLWKVDNKEK